MSKSFSFDVFVSHNAKDKPLVRRLAERLKNAGLRVWFDEWNVQYGDIIALKVDEGLEQSRVLLLCISPNALASGWVALERSTAIHRDPSNEGRCFIPLLLANCELPETLRRYKYLDFRNEADAALEELVNACRAPDVGVSAASAPDGVTTNTWRAEIDRCSNSIVMGPFHLRRTHLHTAVHDDLRLQETEEENQEFELHNRKRVAEGLDGNYNGEIVRLVSKPRCQGSDLYLDVAPLKFSTFAASRKHSSDEAWQALFRQRLADVALRETFDPYKLITLGTEIVVVTRDEKTLLRRRGASVETERFRWDVSASGYVRNDYDRQGELGQLDISKTIMREVKRELGSRVDGDPTELEFLGVHYNAESSAADILTCWKISLSLAELLKELPRAPEGFVRDATNMHLSFDSKECLEAVSQLREAGSQLVPEALFCLAFALGERR